VVEGGVGVMMINEAFSAEGRYEERGDDLDPEEWDIYSVARSGSLRG